jgi:protein-disulfide isomerase
MNGNRVLLSVAVAALVAGVTAAGTSVALLHRAGFSVRDMVRSDTAPPSPEEAKIENIVRDFLKKNPEILVEMTTELDKRQADAQTAQQQKAIGDNAEAIFRSSNSGIAGNPQGDVTVVEFFDYNCGFCRRALPHVVKLVDSDSKVRLVMKELPIFGDDSENAAKLALAAKKQGKYFELHQKLLSEPGKADKEKALRVAKQLGLNIEQLEKDMEDPAVKEELASARAIAEKLSLQGTPLYLVGDQVLPGAPDDLYDQLKAKVAEVRKNGCATTC